MKNYKSKQKNFYFLFVVFIFSFSVFHFAPLGTEAATLYFLPPSYEGSSSSTLLVEIRLNTDGEKVNTVDAHLVFPQDIMEVRDISTGASIVELWAQEPGVSQGKIKFVGGIPTGFQGDGKIASVMFGWKKAGEANLTFAPDSKVLLHDGKATPVALDLMDGGYAGRMQEQAVSVPSISAQFHPDEDAWYMRDEVYLNWQIKPGFEYSYLISRTPSEFADEIPEEAVGEGSIKYENLGEGIFYFSLREKPAGAESFGPPIIRRVMIDRSAPEAFMPNFATIEGKQYLVFFTTDNLSGVARYEVWERPELSIWQKLILNASAQEAWKPARTPYLLERQDMHGIIISVRAVDKAGNIQKAELRTPARAIPFSSTIIFSVLILLGGAFVVVQFFKHKGKVI